MRLWSDINIKKAGEFNVSDPDNLKSARFFIKLDDSISVSGLTLVFGDYQSKIEDAPPPQSE